MSEIKIKPIVGTQNRVVVKAGKLEEKTTGGIIIPGMAKDKPQRGIVYSISDYDDQGKTPQLTVGDEILFGKHTGLEFVLDEVPYLIMKEIDVFAILR
jgi:chaperonin GroES